jgi:hypothetical protein
MTSSSPTHPLLSPSLINDIEDLRKDWEIKGISIAAVKRDEGDPSVGWKTDFLGLGVRDGIAYTSAVTD